MVTRREQVYLVIRAQAAQDRATIDVGNESGRAVDHDHRPTWPLVGLKPAVAAIAPTIRANKVSAPWWPSIDKR